MMRKLGNTFMKKARQRASELLRRPRVKMAVVCIGVAAVACVIVFSYASLIRGGKPHTPKRGGHSLTAKKNTNKNSSAPPSQAAPQSSSTYPSSVLNLANWKLTLPVAGSGNSPEEIKQPQLANFALAPYFQVNDQRNGVQFQAPAGGVTTENSNYPRSELREMTSNGSQEASWSDDSGTHTMTIRQAITHLPAVKPQVVAGQIHDASDDVILIRLEGANLFVQGSGKNLGVLDGNYQLGAVFTVQVIASNGHIRVFYNGVQKVDYQKSGSGYYFKAGCYTQSNPSKGDSPSAYAQVVIYGLQVSQT